jgi:HprK-related kinase A
MTVGQVPFEKFTALLSGQGLRVSMGPFNIRIKTTSVTLAGHLHSLYADYKLADDEIAEFHVQIVPARPVKKPFSPYIRFLVDRHSPYSLFPAEQALAILEWGINLAIAVRVNHLLILHSAVVERNGRVILFPAWPGSGKTTLCTVLVHRGYRLFSDEFGLMDPQQKFFSPIPRLMPLKNESIRVIRDYLPEAILGHEIPNTQKGTVVHVRPPKESIMRSEETAQAKWIIFPKWVAGSSLSLESLPDSEAFLLLASNSFNYEVLGEAGFHAVAHLVRTCSCYKLVYSDFDDVISAMNDLTD